MICAGTFLTNNRYPRVTTAVPKTCRGSEPHKRTQQVRTHKDVTIAAGCLNVTDLTAGPPATAEIPFTPASFSEPLEALQLHSTSDA